MNIAAMSHLSFERADDDTGDVICAFNINGAPSKARLDHKHAVMALGDLLGALQIELTREINVRPIPPVRATDLAHGHPGEPSVPNPAPDAPAQVVRSHVEAALPPPVWAPDA